MGAASERPLPAPGRLRALGPSAARRSRMELRDRVRRLRDRSFLIGQVAVAAGFAWFVAQTVLDHDRPFFAPVAAIVALGVSYGQRLRRVAEVTTGVAVGVGVADLLIHFTGTGTWQLVVVVALSMSIAVILDAGALIVAQAGVQAVIVTTLLPDPSAGLSRWFDAAVGGSVALAVAAVAPATPVRRPRIQASRVLHELSELLHEAAYSARDGDAARATRTLYRARDTDSALSDLRHAAAEGLDVTRSSPLRRRHRGNVQAVAELTEPLDRALHNGRVLIRRVTVAAARGEPVPAAYVDLVDRLAGVVERMAAALREQHLPASARAELRALALASSEVESTGGLSAMVVLAQVRSMIVDLLDITGLDLDGVQGAVAQIPSRPDVD